MHHRLPAALANVTSFYAAPQVPDDARRLWDASCVSAGWHNPIQLPLRASRGSGASLLLAREWGATDLEDRLAAAIEASYEPTWDPERGEFTWGLGLDEPHPRGQFNAFLAAAEAGGSGRWEQLSAAPLDPCPQVVDVDFPLVALRRAEWVDDTLHLAIAPLTEDRARSTSVRIVGASAPAWEVTGLAGTTVETDGGAVDVRVPLVTANLQLRPIST